MIQHYPLFFLFAGFVAGIGLGWRWRTLVYLANPAGRMVARLVSECRACAANAEMMRRNSERLASELSEAQRENRMLKKQLRRVCERLAVEHREIIIGEDFP